MSCERTLQTQVYFDGELDAAAAEVNRLEGIDSQLIGPDRVQELAPTMYAVSATIA